MRSMRVLEEYADLWTHRSMRTRVRMQEDYAGARGVCGSLDTQEHADATCSARAAGGGICKKN